MTTFVPEMRLFDNLGQRLYLNAGERGKFLDAAEKSSPLNIMVGIIAYLGENPRSILKND